MSSRWRRFEGLLPLQFNDGWDVPAEWLAEAILEIVDHFGAASYETQKVEGHWRQGGVLYRDNLVRVVVDVPDSTANRHWMRQFKFDTLLSVPKPSAEALPCSPFDPILAHHNVPQRFLMQRVPGRVDTLRR